MEKLRTVIITGGDSGLGLATARKILQDKQYQVIISSLNLEKGQAAVAQLRQETGNERVEALHMNTASFAAVREFAQECRSFLGQGQIYGLLLNAGINGMHTGMTEDGIELVFQTNYLGHFLLTNLLLDRLEERGKIFVTSSDMHDPPQGELVWPGTEALAHPAPEEQESRQRYPFSKLCMLYLVYELARRLESEGRQIRANAFNPGMMQTNFAPVDEARTQMLRQRMPERVGDLETSSSAYARLVTDDGLATTSANYFDRSINAIKSSALSYDAENARELWVVSEALCGLTSTNT